MGKTLTKEQRKNSKYSLIEFNRKNKYNQYEEEEAPQKSRQKVKWQPHSEIEIE